MEVHNSFLIILLLFVSDSCLNCVHGISIMKKGEESPSIQDLILLPKGPSPKVMPCGTDYEVTREDGDLWVESENFSKKQNYPNSHVCEWAFKFPGRRGVLHCPNFHLNEFLCLDHVQLGDGNAVQNHYCGKQGPRNVILVNKMWIRFSSNSFFPGVGFKCSFRLLPEDEDGDDPLLPSTSEQQRVEDPHCVCGVNNAGTKIVNGSETIPGEVPWQAGLVRSNETVPFCGGSLINDRYILTAAHCVVGRTPYNLEVLLNTEKAVSEQEGFHPDRHMVMEIIAHRNYTPALDYDVALIKIDPPADLSHSTPICLPSAPALKETDFAGVTATVTGWGFTMEDGEVSATLKKTSVQVISNPDCKEKYNKISERMLCAAAPGTDACQGDSGGPLFYESDPGNRKHVQIGIVSWGIGCARPNRPGVYTRVTEIVQWILRTSRDGRYCKENAG